MALADDVQKLYIAYFNRPADTAGLAYWIDQATRNGNSTTAIANAFSASPEYVARYAGMSNAQVVDAVYQNLFNRTAEPSGSTYWSTRLDNGTFTIGNIVVAIMNGAQNADATAVAVKATAAVKFTQNLVTGAQIAAYTGTNAAAIAREWLQKVSDSSSLDTGLSGLTQVIVTIVGGNTSSGGGGGAAPTSQIVSLTGAANLTDNATTDISLTEIGAGQGASNIVINGGKNITVATNHVASTNVATNGLLTIGATTAPAGTVTVTSSVDAGQSGGNIAITGGTTISVTQTSTGAINTTTNMAAVTVTGKAATTSVTVTNPTTATAAAAVTAVTGVIGVTGVTAAPGTKGVTAVTGVAAVTGSAGAVGIVNKTVSITDAQYGTANANTIATVSLSNWGASSEVKSNALTTLTLSGVSGGSLDLRNSNSTGITLAVNLTSTSGTVTLGLQSGWANVMNVVTSGTAATLSVQDTGLRTLNVSGTQLLKLTGTTTIQPVTAINVSGSGGFDDGNNGDSRVGFASRGTAITFSNTSSGPITLSLASTQGFDGTTGTGVDTITISSIATPTQNIKGGASTTDELILDDANDDGYNPGIATSGKISGFEILGVNPNFLPTARPSTSARSAAASTGCIHAAT